MGQKTQREQEELRDRKIQDGDLETARTDWVGNWGESCQERERAGKKDVVLLWVLPQVYPARWELQESWPSSCCIRESHMQAGQLGQRAGVRGHGGMGMCGLKHGKATFTQWCYFIMWTKIKTPQWKDMQWHTGHVHTADKSISA